MHRRLVSRLCSSVFWEARRDIHAHHTRHTHASHAQTHNSKYAHVYTCAHCGRKGFLAIFCYDRVHNENFANRFVWVRKSANPHGPKKVLILKFTPISFDVGVGFHLM